MINTPVSSAQSVRRVARAFDIAAWGALATAGLFALMLLPETGARTPRTEGLTAPPPAALQPHAGLSVGQAEPGMPAASPEAPRKPEGSATVPGRPATEPVANPQVPLNPAAVPAPPEGLGADVSADASAAPPPVSPDLPIRSLADEVIKSYSVFFPAKTYALGILEIDSTLADFRKSTITSFVNAQKGFMDRLEKIKTETLTDEGRVERDALRVHLSTMIWDLETAAVQAHDPDFYIDESIGAIQRLLDREEMSPLARTTFLRNRLVRFGGMFDVARVNLGACSRANVLHAITRLRYARSLFAESLPVELHRGGTLSALRGGQETVAAWKACTDFSGWLEKEKLPKATAAAPLGEKAWQGWMVAREGTSVDPAAVVAAAAADMAKLKDELKIAAGTVAKGKAPEEIIEALSSERLGFAAAQSRAERTLGELYRWILHDKPVELPSDEPVIVREAPAFRRREAPVRANFPGPFFQTSEDSYFEIAAPDPDWPDPILYAWMGTYARPFLSLALMREIYPGRHTQWLFMKRSTAKIGKAGFFPTMGEGWGLYAEELAVRLGFGKEDPKIKVAMLADMIRADARLSASVRLHALGIPPAEVVAWLEREAYWPKLVAVDETAKLLADPGGSDAGFGRLALIALREDVKKSKGSAFILRDFHERLLSFGQVPIAALRKVLLPGDAAPLIGPSK